MSTTKNILTTISFRMKLVTLSILLSLFAGKAYSDAPAWSVDPTSFNNSMTFVGAVYLHSAQQIGNDNVVAAFVNNQCRGVASPTLNATTGYWTYYLTVYGDVNGDSVKFKYYNKSKDSTYTLPQFILFDVNANFGTVFEPNTWSYPALSGAEITAFSLPGQVNSIISGTTISVIMPKDIDVSAVKAKFTTSTGAFVKVGDAIQLSEKSINNFAKPINYIVRSSDGLKLKTYSVQTVSYAMNVVASVFIDSIETASLTDTLYVYINEQLRAKATAALHSEVNAYRFSIPIYNNKDTGTIRFKYYSTTSAKMVDLANSLSFVDSKTKGTVAMPVVLSNPILNGSKIVSFSIPNQIGNAIISSNTVKLIVPKNTSVQSVIATFATSAGSQVMANGAMQHSGISTINLEKGAVYTVYSSTATDSTIYTITVIANTLDQIKAPAIISPNGDGINDYWTIKDAEKLRDSRVYILNSMGTIVYEENGMDAKWDGTYKGSDLPVGVYYYVIKSPGKIISSGNITLLK